MLTRVGTLLGVLLACLPSGATAQAPISLEGDWRFHAGDVSGAEVPGFDDSRWESLPVPGSWDGTPYEDHAGDAWYRRRVSVQPGSEKHRSEREPRKAH